MKMDTRENSDANQDVKVVLVTFPNLETARQIGTLLVKSQVVACINLVPKVESIYQWEGKVTTDEEVLGIIKTTTERFLEVGATLKLHHPYEVPEFIALEPVSGSVDYLDWVAKSCSKPENPQK